MMSYYYVLIREVYRTIRPWAPPLTEKNLPDQSGKVSHKLSALLRKRYKATV